MKKQELAKRLTETKIKWWTIADGEDHRGKARELYKIIMKMNKTEIARNLENYEGKLERAKTTTVV